MSDRAPNPYVGPVPYEINDDRGFYGRDEDLRRLAILFTAQRIVLLHSPSGAGKTSLVHARLIPALEEEGFAVQPIVRMKQQATNGQADGNRFVNATLHALEFEETGTGDAETLLACWARHRTELEHQPAILFFDQFEEVLTVDPHEPQQKVTFFDQLGTILARDDRLWALFAIREDYLAELEPFRHLIPGKLDSAYRLELLNKDQALAAIQRPAEDVGVDFSDEAANKLVEQLRRVRVRGRDGIVRNQEGPYVEPVQLQVVCQTLWHDLKPVVGATIGAESVAAEGHVDASLGKFYDETIERTASKHKFSQRDIRDWFEQALITEQDLRGQVMDSEELELSQAVIDDLVDAHLVRAEERRGVRWYELAHDRLVKPVRECNKIWYEENLSLLQSRSETWIKTPDNELLLHGKQLEDAEAWVVGRKLKDYEHAFLTASQARERARTKRRWLSRAVLLVIAGLVVSLLVVWAWWVQSEAGRAAERQYRSTLEYQRDGLTMSNVELAMSNVELATSNAQLATSNVQLATSIANSNALKRNAVAELGNAVQTADVAVAQLAQYESGTSTPSLPVIPGPSPSATPSRTPSVTPVSSPVGLATTRARDIDLQATRASLRTEDKDLSFVKIGFHTGPGGNKQELRNWMVQLDAAGVPFFLKAVDEFAPIMEAQELKRASGVPHTLVYRTSGNDVPDYSLPPVEAARLHWQVHKATFPLELDPELVWVETVNEPDMAGRPDWLAEFALATAELTLSDGYCWAAFGVNAGEPEPEVWELPAMLEFLRLAAEHPDCLAVSLHEYSFTAGDEPMANTYPELIGRFQYLFQAVDNHEIPRPTVLITEWGWSLDRIPERTEQAMEEIDWAARLYAPYPMLKGAAIWHLGAGWGVDDQVQELITPLTEYALGYYFIFPITP